MPTGFYLNLLQVDLKQDFGSSVLHSLPIFFPSVTFTIALSLFFYYDEDQLQFYNLEGGCTTEVEYRTTTRTRYKNKRLSTYL